MIGNTDPEFGDMQIFLAEISKTSLKKSISDASTTHLRHYEQLVNLTHDATLKRTEPVRRR